MTSAPPGATQLRQPGQAPRWIGQTINQVRHEHEIERPEIGAQRTCIALLEANAVRDQIRWQLQPRFIFHAAFARDAHGRFAPLLHVARRGDKPFREIDANHFAESPGQLKAAPPHPRSRDQAPVRAAAIPNPATAPSRTAPESRKPRAPPSRVGRFVPACRNEKEDTGPAPRRIRRRAGSRGHCALSAELMGPRTSFW